MKKYLDLILSLSQVVSVFSIALGVIIILRYCMEIGFYPQGIEIGDGLFFMWVALVFGGKFIIAILLLSLFSLSLYSLTAVSIKKIFGVNVPLASNDVIFSAHVLTVSFCVLLLISVVGSIIDERMLLNIFTSEGLVLVGVFFVCGLNVTLLLDDHSLSDGNNENFEILNKGNDASNIRKNNRAFSCSVYIFLIIGIPLFFIKGFGYSILDFSVLNIGIKKENVSLYLNEESSLYVKNLVDEHGHDIHVVPVSNGKHRVDNATVLFQGIGDKTHISLGASQKKLLFDLPSSSVVVSRVVKVEK